MERGFLPYGKILKVKPNRGWILYRQFGGE
jgi:hypothetical protein